MSDSGRGLRLQDRQRDREFEAEIEERRRERTSGHVSALRSVCSEGEE